MGTKVDYAAAVVSVWLPPLNGLKCCEPKMTTAADLLKRERA